MAKTTDFPICPHCGQTNSVSDTLETLNILQVEDSSRSVSQICDYCFKWYDISMEIHYTTSEPHDPDLSKENEEDE